MAAGKTPDINSNQIKMRPLSQRHFPRQVTRDTRLRTSRGE
jgi:hypothetical protein